VRIGIDCDGVLRDFIPDVINKIKETHPQHTDKILTPTSWDWEQWLPFWTEDETEEYVFEEHYKELFGSEANPIPSSLEDFPKLKEWAKENDHELVLVSAQREHCEEPTMEWLQRWGFMFDEYHFTKEKWSIDVDVLIDDSPEKLDIFNERSVSYGKSICYKQTWNHKHQTEYMVIDRLGDLIGKLFG
jgi:5'(3')-deoxyribonucleotidase